jgi:hypothetical protein
MDEKTQKHVFWHFQPTIVTGQRFTGRLFMPGLSYYNRDPYAGTIQIDLHPDGVVYLHAAHMDQTLVTTRHWRELARQLQRELGATDITAEHKEADLLIPTTRAMPLEP